MENIIRDLIHELTQRRPDVLSIMRDELVRTGACDCVWLEENLGRRIEEAGLTIAQYEMAIDVLRPAVKGMLLWGAPRG